MRPIPGADIVEYSKQETKQQDDDSGINGKTQYRQDFINRADPRRLKVETQILLDLPVVDQLIRMKSNVSNDDLSKFDDIQKAIDEQMSQLDAEYR